jgi:LPS O-antigen subunit length determinant protein (WzzB/FepE family)
MKILFTVFALLTMLLANEPAKWEVNKTKAINLDMVYNLDLKKYPKFLCEAKLKNGKVVQFVSVKAMMQVYFHQDYFKKRKLLEANIDKMYVKDYLDGSKIEASKALYMFGSRLVGPHGDDLIPLKNQESAKLFKIKYGGTKLLPFSKITKGLIRYLDM